MASQELLQFIESKLEFTPYYNTRDDLVPEKKSLHVEQDSEFIKIIVSLTLANSVRWNETSYQYRDNFNWSWTGEIYNTIDTDEMMQSWISQQGRNFITSSPSNVLSTALEEKKADLELEILDVDKPNRKISYAIKIPKNVLEFNDSIWLNSNFKYFYLYTYYVYPEGGGVEHRGKELTPNLGIRFPLYNDQSMFYQSYKIRLSDPDFFNQKPNVTLSTPNNQTLYENDTLTIDGSATDNDPNQSVTVYYQINSDAKKVLATNLSKINIPFNRSLVFKSGKLYDGDVAVSGTLADGVAHTLKVWAQDNEGAESTPQTRTFYVVPNRAPTLSIDEVVPNGNIDSDKFTISGHAGDLDANANVTVTYRINENNSIQVYEGPGGAFSFDIALGQLVVGQNTIVVEVIDNYGAKTSKTIKLNKNEIKTPLLKSTARYKLEPPSGSAKGVLLYIQRDKNLVIDAKISMTLKGEPENFVPMTLENTAPLPNDETILEDEFYYETTESKDNIILQIDMIRSSTDVNDKITLIQGAFD